MRYGLSVHSSEKSSQPAPFPNIHHHLKTVIHHSVMIANPLKWIFFLFLSRSQKLRREKVGRKTGKRATSPISDGWKKGSHPSRSWWLQSIIIYQILSSVWDTFCKCRIHFVRTRQAFFHVTKPSRNGCVPLWDWHIAFELLHFFPPFVPHPSSPKLRPSSIWQFGNCFSLVFVPTIVIFFLFFRLPFVPESVIEKPSTPSYLFGG